MKPKGGEPMNEKTVKETAQAEPSKKVKIAQAATTIAANVFATVIVSVVAEQISKQINKKFFPDQED
jgi:ribosomal protein L11 methylase PrmA